jgi:hypothetical protein
MARQSGVQVHLNVVHCGGRLPAQFGNKPRDGVVYLVARALPCADSNDRAQLGRLIIERRIFRAIRGRCTVWARALPHFPSGCVNALRHSTLMNLTAFAGVWTHVAACSQPATIRSAQSCDDGPREAEAAPHMADLQIPDLCFTQPKQG